MNTCESYAALLDALAEGDLFTEDLIQVQQHLNHCPDCQAYLDDLLTIRAAFPSVEDTEVPEGFADGVMAAIRANAAPRDAAPQKAAKKKTPWGKILLPLAACCAIVVLLQGMPTRNFKSTAEEAATTESASGSAAPRDATASSAEQKKSEAPIAAGPETFAVYDTEPASDAGDALSDVSHSGANTQLEPAEAEPSPVDRDTAPVEGSEQQTAAVTYQAVLTLPAEASDLLADFTPTEETETELRYLLSMSDCALVQSRLDEAEITYTAEEGVQPTSSKALIILSK